LVAALTIEQVNEIDNAILSAAKTHGRKVAMIVGLVMMNSPNRISGIPDIFYAQRVKVLVSKGLLLSDGNLDYMRFSEVRLPS
jgi:Protein of unknown function